MLFKAYHARGRVTSPNGPWNDIPYVPVTHADFDATRHQFDLELPSGSGPFAVGVFVHAGGFNSGSKDTPPSHWTRGLITRGVAYASVGYRLAPTHIWPKQRYDIGAFIRYLRMHAAAYNINPDRIGLIGYSAGAAISLFMGVTANLPLYAGPFGNNHISEKVKCIYNFASLTRIATEESEMVTNFGSVTRTVGSTTSQEANLIGGLNPYSAGAGVTAAAEASAYSNVQAYNVANCPDFISLRHGEADTTIPYQQSQNMHPVLQTAGYSSEFISYVSLTHSTIVTDVPTTDDLLDDFVARVTA